MSNIDDDVQAHFDDLRAEDASHAPEFSALWRGAERQATVSVGPRPRTRGVWAGVLMAAAASAVIIAALRVEQERRSDVVADATIADTVPHVSITSWRSPTAGLLYQSQQMTFLSPSLFGSVLDGLVTPLAQPDSPKRGGL